MADGLGDLKGVGPVRLRQLARVGIRSVGDALRCLPRRYEDRRRTAPLGALRPGESALVRGTVKRANLTFPGRRRLFEALLDDGTGVLHAVWYRFNETYLRRLVVPGEEVCLFGLLRQGRGGGQMAHPEIVRRDRRGRCEGGGLLPVYPSTEGLSARVLRSIVAQAVEAALPEEEDFLPGDLVRRLGLPTLEESLRRLHEPGPEADAAALNSWSTPWHRRLIFEELLLLQLGLLTRRRAGRAASAVPSGRRGRAESLKSLLPYELTAAQERVWEEIALEMTSPRPMQRLLQGDVGSGKTVVALLAICLAADGGFQSALMAPTEILAEQHYLSLRDLAARVGLRVALFTGSVPAAARGPRLAGLEAGEFDLAVGTQALLQPAVRFRRLGLVVIDEQHRFGVRQRAGLLRKGESPHVLTMTATPIPRSLALTLYGDLEVSLLDEMPPGRRPVRTRICPAAQRGAALDAVRRELQAGGRAFVVFPFVEGREDGAGHSLREWEEKLRGEFFPDTPLAVLHGGMPLEERSRQVGQFRRGERPLLAATTVVEVGVDVPEATIMVVLGAERFGLAQLHQLRGRVGRGARPASCYLVTGERPTEEARRRLAVLGATNDGFRIAEEDLAQRGPGEMLGARQSGLPRLGVADLVRDAELLLVARREAKEILAADPGLRRPAHRSLGRRVREAWRGNYPFAESG